MDTNNKNLFMAVGFLIIIVIVVGVLYTRKPSVPPVLSNTATTTTSSTLAYSSNEYGFTVSLPESWQGYSVASSTWEGDTSGSASGESKLTSGPIILIRHPLWTAAHPRQDIPVMVFTIPQWNELQADKYHIGAAPIGPTELGSNSTYVFALPARYNYAYLPGYEEVDQIVTGKNFTFFEPVQ